MDDRNITGGNRHNSCNQSLFNDIMLGRTEMYDASKLSCWPFCRATDVRDGIPLSLGNLCIGYPFALNGHIFLTSEAAYLCGEFSDSSSKQSIQYSLMEEPNAFLAKKVIKRKNLKYVRQDWEEIRLQCFMQYEFMKQWQALRAYAAEKNVRIIGDVPIYVPMDSAEVWTEPELFQLDEDLYPVVVAGCPPDAFTADGQLWGNPIYRWQQHAATGYEWWIHRLRAAGKLYDVIRIDHFRAFESYWAVPYGDKTARGGAWVKGPGMDFLRAIRNALPDLDFIAEDLGFITPEVRQLQVDSGYPGMKVIEFAFDSREESDYLPHRYPVDSVCYTGTHDNVTVKQWFDEAAREDVAFAKAYLGLNSEEGWVWGMIRGGMGSVSRLFVAQMQDYLELGKAGRMNFPGTLTNDNWTWRAEEGFDADALADRIYTMTCMYGRCPRRPEPEAEETEETEA